MQNSKNALSFVKLFTIMCFLFFFIGLHNPALSRELCGELGLPACTDGTVPECSQERIKSQLNGFCLDKIQINTSLPTTPMRSRFSGEIARNKVISSNEGSRKPMQIVASDGIIYLIDDTENGLVYGTNETLYVMDEYGNIYVKSINNGENNTIPFFKHSSFFNEDPVAAAGTLTWNATDNSVKVSNNSGHYRPKKKPFIDNVVNQLKLMGVNAVVGTIH